MRYSILGRSGLRVSNIALGTLTFGLGPEDEARAIWDAYAEAGGNFVDTANMYQYGESEKLLGKFLGGDRDRYVVTSKYANKQPGANDPNAAGIHRKSLVQSIDGTLERLGIDYVDLYLVHFWDFTQSVEEVQRALEDTITAGKILHFGLSDVPAWVVSRAQAFSDTRGLPPVSCMQLEYSLVQRSIEREHLPLARTHNIGVTAWSPLASGILGGKFASGSREKSVRPDDLQFQEFDDRNRRIAESVDAIAKRLGLRMSQVSLAWLMARGVIPIVGATKAAQIRESMVAADIQLDKVVMNELDELSTFDTGHPYNMLEWDLSMQLGYGGMFQQIDIPNFPGKYN